MKKYKILLTDKQITILNMIIREARDGNAYQDGETYEAILKQIDKFADKIWRQMRLQGWTPKRFPLKRR